MATEHTPAIEELLSVHALGALDGEDLRTVEEHLAGRCPECAWLLAELAGGVEGLAAGAPPVAPSDTARARLLRALGEPAASSSPPPARRRAPAWSWLAAAAALLLLVWGVATRSALTGEVAALRAELSRLRADRDRVASQATGLAAELARAEASNERLAQAMAIISSPAMKPVALAGLKDAPGARGHTFVDPEAKRAVFVAANLPPLAPGKTYELWFITGGKGGKPVPAGTFPVDAKGSATVAVANVPPVAQIQVWAVTVEPQGGVPQPTGPMVLKG
jgi:anti-sigma-K factor RskA